MIIRTLSWTIGGLCAVAVGAGCGAPLCPSTTFPAQILVHLSPDWTATAGMVVIIDCPPEQECGFLDGPSRGSADGSVSIHTVLRPSEVQVQVRSAAGDVLREIRLPVAYEPRGPRQTPCGGDAQALVLVPAA